jgi:ATP-dependent Lon protease
MNTAISNFPINNRMTTLAKFEINHNDEDFCLAFIVSDNNFEGQNFNVFLDVDEIERKLEENAKLQAEYSSLLELKNKIDSSERMSPLLKNEIRRFNRKLYLMTRNESTTLDDYKLAIPNLLNVYEEKIDNSDLDSLLKGEKHKKLQMLDSLKSKDMLYITHLDNERILLCKTTVDVSTLIGCGSFRLTPLFLTKA